MTIAIATQNTPLHYMEMLTGKTVHCPAELRRDSIMNHDFQIMTTSPHPFPASAWTALHGLPARAVHDLRRPESHKATHLARATPIVTHRLRCLQTDRLQHAPSQHDTGLCVAGEASPRPMDSAGVAARQRSPRGRGTGILQHALTSRAPRRTSCKLQTAPTATSWAGDLVPRHPLHRTSGSPSNCPSLLEPGRHLRRDPLNAPADIALLPHVNTWRAPKFTILPVQASTRSLQLREAPTPSSCVRAAPAHATDRERFADASRCCARRSSSDGGRPICVPRGIERQDREGDRRSSESAGLPVSSSPW